MKIKESKNNFYIENNLENFQTVELSKFIEVDEYGKIILLLICNILDKRTNNLDELAFNQELAKNYDFKIKITLLELANGCFLRYKFNFLEEFINPKKIKTIIEEVIKNDYYDQTLIKDAINNYKLSLFNILDDPQVYSLNLLENQLFKKLSIDEKIKFVDNLKEEDFVKILDKIKNTQFSIKIESNTKEKKDLSLKLDTNFVNTYPITSNLNFIEDKNYDQANLILIYQLPKNLQLEIKKLFNICFGGNANSLMFKIIRESMHLCYSIYSKIINEDLLIIHIGLLHEKIILAEEKIGEIIKNPNSYLTNNDVVNAKKFYKDYLIKNNESLVFQTNRIYQKVIKNQSLDIYEEIKNLENITINDLIPIFDELKFIGRVILK